MSTYGEPRNPDEYRDDKGAFSVDIIVYKEADWIKIADFLSQLVRKDPGNKPMADAHEEAERYASIARAEKLAEKEIRKNRTADQRIKKRSQPTGSATFARGTTTGGGIVQRR